MTTTKTFNVKLGFIPSLVLGMLVYLLMHDTFSWADPWLYVYMVFWPFILIYYFFMYAIVIVLVLCFLYALLKGCQAIDNYVRYGNKITVQHVRRKR